MNVSTKQQMGRKRDSQRASVERENFIEREREKFRTRKKKKKLINKESFNWRKNCNHQQYKRSHKTRFYKDVTFIRTVRDRLRFLCIFE